MDSSIVLIVNESIQASRDQARVVADVVTMLAVFYAVVLIQWQRGG